MPAIIAESIDAGSGPIFLWKRANAQFTLPPRAAGLQRTASPAALIRISSHNRLIWTSTESLNA
jgi:hypothetical protein